jgi:hypothetical protein
MTIRALVLFTAALLSVSVAAESIEGVEFPATASAGGKELKLNGLALRKVERFGLPFKVYVAALYAEKKLATTEEALADAGPKVLRMRFLRRVNSPDMVSSFETGHAANCGKDCEASKKVLKEFTDKMPDMLDKQTIEFRFLPDGVEYDVKGRKEIAGKLNGEAISKNLLAVFIGPKPPTQPFKDGLLGTAAK